MKLRRVKVEATVYTVISGLVGLDGDQAKTRLHKLKAVDGEVDTNPKSKNFRAGVYEVLESIQFIRGEEFGYSGAAMPNGELRDPEAEQLKAMQAEEDKEKAVKVAVRAAEEKLREQYAGKLQKAVADMRAELEATLRKELEPKLRAELAAAKA